MTFWTMLYVNWLVIQLTHILSYLLNSISRLCYMVWASWLLPFLQFLRTLFLLVSLAFMVTLTGLTLSSYLPLACSSLHPLWKVSKPDLQLASSLMSKNSLCQVLVVGPWQKNHTQKLELGMIRAVGSHLTVPLIPWRRGYISDGIPAVWQSINSSASSSVVQIGTLPQFLDQWRSIASNRFVFNMVKDHYLQLRCHPMFW